MPACPPVQADVPPPGAVPAEGRAHVLVQTPSAQKTRIVVLGSGSAGLGQCCYCCHGQRCCCYCCAPAEHLRLALTCFLLLVPIFLPHSWGAISFLKSLDHEAFKSEAQGIQATASGHLLPLRCSLPPALASHLQRTNLPNAKYHGDTAPREQL